MKKLVKNVLALILCAVLLAAMPVEAETDSGIMMRMINDLLYYLNYSELVYSDVEAVLDAVEKFEETREWDDLVIARACVTLAMNDIDELKLPEPSLTDDDIVDLMIAGVDAAFFVDAPLAYEVERLDLYYFLYNLNNALWSDVFLDNLWSVKVKEVKVYRQIIDLYFDNLANLADSTLLEISDENRRSLLNEAISIYCPKTNSRRTETPLDEETLENAQNQIGDELEELLNERNRLLAEYQLINDYLNDAYDSKDYTIYVENAVQINNLPHLMPMPEWIDISQIVYFWQNGDQIIVQPDLGAPISKPSACIMYGDNVSIDTLYDYIMANKLYAPVDAYHKAEEDGESFSYFIDDDAVMFMYESNSVSIFMTGEIVCFIPYLYLSNR